jgi:hypothetical protein
MTNWENQQKSDMDKTMSKYLCGVSQIAPGSAKRRKTSRTPVPGETTIMRATNNSTNNKKHTTNTAVQIAAAFARLIFSGRISFK